MNMLIPNIDTVLAIGGQASGPGPGKRPRTSVSTGDDGKNKNTRVHRSRGVVSPAGNA